MRWDPDARDARPGLAVLGGPAPDVAAALVAWLLAEVGARPGFALPVRSRNFGEAARVGHGPVVVSLPWAGAGDAAAGRPARAPEGPPTSPAGMGPLRPAAALVCGSPAPADVAGARAFLSLLPGDVPVVVDRADPAAVELVAARPASVTHGYALEGERTAGAAPEWLGAPYAFQGGVMPLELFVGGTSCGRVFSPLVGAALARLAVGAVALAAAHAGVPVRSAAAGLRGFLGVEGFLEPHALAAGVAVLRHAPGDDPRRDEAAVAALRAARPRARIHALGVPGGAAAGDVDRVCPGGRGGAVAEAIDGLGVGDALLVLAGVDVADEATAALVARHLGRPPAGTGVSPSSGSGVAGPREG